MKVVLDTNVMVSALLVPQGHSAQVLREFRDGVWQLVTSGTILEEYGEVLRRPKFGLHPQKIADLLRDIEIRSIQVIPAKRYQAIIADPDDNEFIDVSVEAKADFLVSGDHHVLKLKTFRGVAICSPAQFMARV